jgi:hypothetical protein
LLFEGKSTFDEKSEDEFLNFGGNLLEKLDIVYNNKNNAQSNTPKCTTQGRV